MDSILKVEVPVSVSRPYYTIGLVRDHNGCCSNRPILITGNKVDDHINYSCQCACGMWCTNGHRSASEALKEYEEMTMKYKEEMKHEEG